MTKEDSLQIFLIKRILIVMAFIYISEQVIELLRLQFFMPILQDILKVGEIPQTNESILSSIHMIMNVLWNIYSRAVPSSIRWIGQNVFEMNALNIAPEFINQYGSLMVTLYYVTILEILVLQLFLSIVPFILGGWWYIHSIHIKVDELRKQDEEKRIEFEKQRNLLFSDIAHDIKTPITSIVGYSRALADDVIVDTEQRHEYLNSIYGKSMRIANLITLLFEFVKLDSAGFTLNKERLDLAELIRNNVIDLLPDFEEKNIELDIDIPEDLCMVYVDKLQMSRVITNILTNAIRYIDKGNEVQIKLDRKGDYYYINIADNGLEIDEEFVKTIFNPFSRSDKARQTTSGGSGLGLSISKKISQMHDGDLNLNLNYGQGFHKSFEIKVPILQEKA